MTPFDGTPLNEIFLLVVPPQSLLPAPPGTNATEADTSTSSPFHVSGSSDGSPDGSKSTDLIESGFLSMMFV